MEVILLERIHRLGVTGDVVKVKDGFGRNFLIPKKKALRASETNKKLFEERRHIIEQQNAEAKANAEKESKQFDGLTVTVVRQASEDGKLYGSVTVRDVAEAMEALGHRVPRSNIHLVGAIKNTGPAAFTVALHPEVVVKIALNVARPDEQSVA